MKNFRSYKNLKPLDYQTKQEVSLKMKVKLLQEQIKMLQSSNLNLFIPISEHQITQTKDYETIIKKMKLRILQLEHENQNERLLSKKIIKEKEDIINKLNEKNFEISQQNNSLKQKIIAVQQKCQEIQNQFAKKKLQCEQLEKNLIEKNVELKFISEDLEVFKLKYKNSQLKIKELKENISEVLYSSRIYKSKQIKCICIEKSQYDLLKQKIRLLQQKIDTKKQSKNLSTVNLGIKKSDIGEEIVRLKKNIDMQLGIKGQSQPSKDFLKAYKGTKQLFSQLIKKCHD